jgi:hypothetical protein
MNSGNLNRGCISLGRPLASLLCLAVCAGLAWSAQERTPLSLVEAASLIPQVEAAERAFRNLKVESEAHLETKTSPEDPWQRTPVCVSSTAWFEGFPRAKIRVDVGKEVSQWLDGAAPYYEESYSMAFDGREGRLVKKTFGYNGQTHADSEGELVSEIPRRLNTGWCNGFTGGRFSLYFFFANDPRCHSFSQMLRETTSSRTTEARPFDFSVEMFQGTHCIKIASALGGDKMRVAYWLDPSRGYALRGYELVNIREDGSEWLVSRITVSKVKQVAPGVWWPLDASDESSPPRPGEPYRLFTYHASDAVANRKDFDEQIFTVPFAEGSLVNDKINHTKFRVVQGQKVEEKR